MITGRFKKGDKPVIGVRIRFVSKLHWKNPKPTKCDIYPGENIQGRGGGRIGISTSALGISEEGMGPEMVIVSYWNQILHLQPLSYTFPSSVIISRTTSMHVGRSPNLIMDLMLS